MRRCAELAAVVAALALVVAAPSWAGVHVARGDTVDELRVVGQDVRVDGHVHGPVLVVAGRLSVGATGQVANVTIIGGKIEAAPGARVEGDVFQLGGSIPELSGWKLLLALVGLVALRTLLVWLILLAADTLTGTRLVPVLAERFQAGPGRALLAGLLGSLGALALSVLAALTFVGLPVALMLWGSVIICLVAGLATTLHALELRSEKRRGIFTVLAIPLIGDALLAFALAVGVGAVLRWFGTPRRDAEHAGVSVP